MKHYFSSYVEKFEKQDKRTRIALSVAAFGILLFFGIAITFPFRNTLFAGLFPKTASRAQVADTIAQRKQEVINNAITTPYPKLDDPNIATRCIGQIAYAYASVVTNKNLDTASNYILQVNSQPLCTVSQDRKTEEFSAYFQMPLLWKMYADPTLRSRLSPQAQTAIVGMMWRWVVDRSSFSLPTTPNRSPWDVYGSENHEATQGAAHLIALQTLMDTPGYGPNRQLADGRTVAQHYNAWVGYWMRYFQERSKQGLSIEIASPGYAKYTVANYTNIYDLTKSQALKNQAKNFLDLYYADVAQEFMPVGLRGGGETRAYQDNNSFSGAFSLRYWLNMYDWYGGAITKTDHPMILVPATSSYNPPDIIRAIAQDANKPPFAYISRRIGLLDPTKGSKGVYYPEITGPMYYMQVAGGSFIKRYSYITPEYILGTIQFNSGKVYSALTDQNRLMGAFFNDGTNSRIIVNGRGTDHCTRTGYAEINGITGPNAMIIGRDPRVNRSNAVHVFISNGKLSDNLSPSVENGWLFTRNDKGAFVAIRIASGSYVKENATWQEEDGTTCLTNNVNGIFLTLKDLWSPVVIQLARASDFQKTQISPTTTQVQQAAVIIPTVTSLSSSASSQLLPTQSSQSAQALSATPSATATLTTTNTPVPIPTLTVDQAFTAFKDKVKALPFTYSGGKLTYNSLNGDTFEYWAQSANVAKINGDSNLNPANTYDSPYIKQIYGQPTTNITYGGQTMTLNTNCVAVGSDTCAAMIPDTTPPNVTITSPSNGGKVKENKKETIRATASDNTGITKVEFYIDGKLKCTVSSVPYQCNRDVPKKDGAKYNLKATAYDIAGNTNSKTISVETPKDKKKKNNNGGGNNKNNNKNNNKKKK